MNIIDRRNEAMGGQNNTRSKSAIKKIAWHYTAVARKQRSFITNHEIYWRDTHGWTYGGYHYYIDVDGKIYQNYNVETVTNGVANNNSYIVNICVEANSANDYSKEQVEARDWLTRKLMKELGISASNVLGHKEFPGNSTTGCPGYTVAQMDQFRKELSNGKTVTKPKKTTITQIKVDGYLGKETIRRLQQYFGTPQDGVLSEPSMVVKPLQKLIGTKVDGYWGKNTTKALQKYFGTPQDGVLSEPSMVIKELQRRLNKGKL